MIANCLILGIDWKKTWHAEHQAMLAGWNARHSDQPEVDMDKVRRAMSAGLH